MTGAGRILVIDDSTTLRKVVEIAMRGSGCALDFAASGTAGLAHARNVRPDVVLLDYLLPDVKSSLVCEQLASVPSTADVPVVVMSAKTRDVLVDFHAIPTVVDFVGKPFTAVQIRTCLERAIRRGVQRGSDDAPRVEAGGTSAVVRPVALSGDVAAAPLLDIMRLLFTSRATGELDVQADEHYRATFRHGDLVLCTALRLELGAVASALAPDLIARARADQLAGKPAAITLAEAGVRTASDLPSELHATGARVLAHLVSLRTGRFAWTPLPGLPAYVDAYGRSISVTTAALARPRDATETGELPPGLHECVYRRTPRFSEKLAGARLDAAQQRVLALTDGTTTVGEVIQRLGLTPRRVHALLAQLAEADLVRAEPVVATQSARRLVAILDPDAEVLATALRGMFAGRAQPVDVISSLPADHARAPSSARPHLVLVNARSLTDAALARTVQGLASEGVTTVVVLDGPSASETARWRDAGFSTVVAKPVHISELDRLLPQ